MTDDAILLGLMQQKIGIKQHFLCKPHFDKGKA
jgi:hypothetical protein